MPDVHGREVGQMPLTTTCTGNCQSTPVEWEFDSIHQLMTITG